MLPWMHFYVFFFDIRSQPVFQLFMHFDLGEDMMKTVMWVHDVCVCVYVSAAAGFLQDMIYDIQ